MTRITDLIGIKYPIFQGGMAWVADWHIAAAVSEAGGLGIIGVGGADENWLRDQIKKCREATDKPFGVNLMLMNPRAPEIAKVIAEEKVKVVTTGASESTDNVIGTTPFGGYASPVSAHFETNRQGAELDSLDFIDMNEVMNHQVSPYNGGELDPVAENELSKVESLLSDHDYQVSIYSVRK